MSEQCEWRSTNNVYIEQQLRVRWWSQVSCDEEFVCIRVNCQRLKLFHHRVSFGVPLSISSGIPPQEWVGIRWWRHRVREGVLLLWREYELWWRVNVVFTWELIVKVEGGIRSSVRMKLSPNHSRFSYIFYFIFKWKSWIVTYKPMNISIF